MSNDHFMILAQDNISTLVFDTRVKTYKFVIIMLSWVLRLCLICCWQSNLENKFPTWTWFLGHPVYKNTKYSKNVIFINSFTIHIIIYWIPNFPLSIYFTKHISFNYWLLYIVQCKHCIIYTAQSLEGQ